jgi:hypothetical protein
MLTHMQAPCLLDTTDPAAVCAYERAFHAAFRLLDNAALREIWRWDDAEQRLATRLRYPDQLVFVSQTDAGIAAACAVNVAMQQTQASIYDFTLPSEEGTCEVLTFFTTPGSSAGASCEFFRACLSALAARGRRVAHATCAERLLRAYRRIGWNLVTSGTFAGHTRHLLRIEMRPPPASAPTPWHCTESALG